MTPQPAPVESRVRAHHALDRIDDLLDRLDAATFELVARFDPKEEPRAPEHR